MTTAERVCERRVVELADREPGVRRERLEELRVVVDDRGGPAALEQSGGEAARHGAVERVEEVEDRPFGRDQPGRVTANHRDVPASPEPLGRCRAELGVELDPLDPVYGEAVDQPVERPALAAADVDDHVCGADRDVAEDAVEILVGRVRRVERAEMLVTAPDGSAERAAVAEVAEGAAEHDRGPLDRRRELHVARLRRVVLTREVSCVASSPAFASLAGPRIAVRVALILRARKVGAKTTAFRSSRVSFAYCSL